MKPFSTINMFIPSVSLIRRPLPRLLYDDANDRAKHAHNMASLAEEMHKAVEDVTPLYEDILAHMKAKAVIPDYLPILVSKRVKYLLQN